MVMQTLEHIKKEDSSLIFSLLLLNPILNLDKAERRVYRERIRDIQKESEK